MKITIDVAAGPRHEEPTALDMEKNIKALQRVIDNKKLSSDDILLMDTMSILEAIKKAIAGMPLPDSDDDILIRYHKLGHRLIDNGNGKISVRYENYIVRKDLNREELLQNLKVEEKKWKS